jgi:hypothetical protein
MCGSRIIAKDLIDRGDNLLMDVGEPEEMEADGKIEGAYNILFGQLIIIIIQDALDDLRGKTIVTYVMVVINAILAQPI